MITRPGESFANIDTAKWRREGADRVLNDWFWSGEWIDPREEWEKLRRFGPHDGNGDLIPCEFCHGVTHHVNCCKVVLSVARAP